MLVINQQLIKNIINIHNISPEVAETRNLINLITGKVNARSDAYLLAEELDQIMKWKLDKQYMHSKEQRKVNVDSVVVPITKAAFSIRSKNYDYETELKIKTLTAMRSVAIPLATAVLAITDPNKYAVIDSVLWEYIYKKYKNSFTVNDLHYVS